jgi:uncharacterized protein YjbI with pentapeptide repeats
VDIDLIYWVVYIGILILMGVLAYTFGRISGKLDKSGIKNSWERRKFRKHWWANWWQGVSTEMVGAILTAILLGVVVSTIQQQQAEAERKRELILQMGSPDNAFAVEAVRILTAEGWVYDGTLQDVELIFPNLAEADLSDANLTGAVLYSANLEGADLIATNLEGAELYRANLVGADLFRANLAGAMLWDANLAGADLREANLEGLTLPDGTKLPGRTIDEWENDVPELDWRTPFNEWHKWFVLQQEEIERLRAAQTPEERQPILDNMKKTGLLENAHLININLEGADLEGANLAGANLFCANLTGANLAFANLEDANLEGATLPDGTKLPGRPFTISKDPEPDWRTPFEAWDKAGRPRIEPVDEGSEGGEE